MSIINKIRTIRLNKFPNVIWVEIETNEGLIGLGEAFRGVSAIEAIINDDIGPLLIGKDSKNIENISITLMDSYLGFNSSSAEVRAASAIDIALWDLYGLRHGIPVFEALGGASRDRIPVYNTCAGYNFNNKSSNYNSGSSRRVITQEDKLVGPYDDQVAFMQDAGELAKSLLSEGYHGMKIWPFDEFAEKTKGQYISLEDLEKGLEPFRKIREAVGNKIEIMCELHSLWNLTSAIRICKKLEEFDVLWVEDPLDKMDNINALRYLNDKVNIPICGSETLGGSVTFQETVSNNTLDYVMVDLGWCGGLTEGRKIANIANNHNLPFTPHDCSGPIILWAGIHLSLHSKSGVFQEVVRASLDTWYKELVTELPNIQNGYIELPNQAGIGTKLSSNVKKHKDVIINEVNNI